MIGSGQRNGASAVRKLGIIEGYPALRYIYQ
jgi:hypothetical protein